MIGSFQHVLDQMIASTSTTVLRRLNYDASKLLALAREEKDAASVYYFEIAVKRMNAEIARRDAQGT